MLTVKPEKNSDLVAQMYEKHSIPFAQDESMAVVAKEGDTPLGYCLFSVKNNVVTVHYLEPLEDFFLADGILRSSLHVALFNGATDAFYDNDSMENFLVKDAFIKNKDTKELNVQKLFSSCCNCEKS